MEENSIKEEINYSELFYGTNNSNQINTTNDIIGKSFTDIEPILKEEDLYICLCPKCQIIPFIEFKNIKNIFFTCLCQNHKKIGIKDLFEKKKKKYIIKHNDSENSYFLSDNINDDYEELKCKEHNLTFKYFCKTCLLNICEKCIFKHVLNRHKFIKLESIKIDNEQLREIITKINPNNQNDNFCIEIIKLQYKKENVLEKINQDELNQFNKLIRIIINNYKKYPHIFNYFNIKNIFHFFIKKDNKGNIDINQKESHNNNNIQSNEKDEIIIQYINNNTGNNNTGNNNTGRTNLFSRKFVKNNKKKTYLTINDRKFPLLSQHKFENNEKIITVKLIVKENINEIDMSEMFENCYNLISVDGIAKLKRTKIINQYKMFYNCTSLISIKDIDDWKFPEDIDNYLMFYNCFSLQVINNNIIKNNIDLGILITKYLRKRKELLFK
jgi:hypothetical protein